MSATFDWQESNGAGETITTGRTETNWKNIDDSTTAYSSSPVVIPSNSFDKWQFGKFTGTFNQILNGLWSHTSVALGTGLTLKASKAMTADGDRLAYATPSTATNANLTYDATAVTAIGSGKAVWFGATGPANSGKAASSTNATTYTNYLTTQLQVASGAAAGDTAVPVLTLQYDEN